MLRLVYIHHASPCSKCMRWWAEFTKRILTILFHRSGRYDRHLTRPVHRLKETLPLGTCIPQWMRVHPILETLIKWRLSCLIPCHMGFIGWVLYSTHVVTFPTTLSSKSQRSMHVSVHGSFDAKWINLFLYHWFMMLSYPKQDSRCQRMDFAQN